jgi:hypothetical protein
MFLRGILGSDDRCAGSVESCRGLGRLVGDAHSIGRLPGGLEAVGHHQRHDLAVVRDLGTAQWYNAFGCGSAIAKELGLAHVA